jgi:hypothetical protein
VTGTKRRHPATRSRPIRGGNREIPPLIAGRRDAKASSRLRAVRGKPPVRAKEWLPRSCPAIVENVRPGYHALASMERQVG